MMQRPTLTVVVPTRDDYHGAWFTVMSLLDHHGDHVDEIIVVDNSPQDSEHASLLRKDLSGIAKVRYDRIIGPESSCKYKDRGIRKATSEYILCCDSHVLFPASAIAALLDHYRRDPQTRDLIMGPICRSGGRVMATQQALYEWEGLTPKDAQVHHGVVCRGGNLGAWATDPRGLDPSGEPFEIQQQGTGAFSCRRDAWPGWPASFNGHGGNETYLMEAFRQAGGKVLCLPAFRWTHRFGRTTDWERNGQRSNIPYDMQWEPKVRNYLTGFALLDRPQLYDAIAAHLPRFCPQVTKKAMSLLRRPPGLIDSLTTQWREAGGSTEKIPTQLFHAIRQRLMGVTYTAEFGSGLSTLLFDAFRRQHLCLEQDLDQVEQLRPLLTNDSTDLHHTPIVDGPEPWYDWHPDGRQIDLLLIHGPAGHVAGCRHFLADLLAPAATLFVADTQHAEQSQLSDDLAGMYGFKAHRVQCPGGRAFDILTRQADSTVYEFGVGTELGAILKERWNMEPLVSCGCKGRMREMNYRGIDWCRRHTETIVDWLLEGAQRWQANQQGLSGLITRTWLAIVPEFAERAYLRSVVEEAIGRGAGKEVGEQA